MYSLPLTCTIFLQPVRSSFFSRRGGSMTGNHSDPLGAYGVGDGTRTHNAWNHNPVLYRLNYTHHNFNRKLNLPVQGRRRKFNFPFQKIYLSFFGELNFSFRKTFLSRDLTFPFQGRLHFPFPENLPFPFKRNDFQGTGTPEGTRTPHLLLRRQLLYPDELLAPIL